MPATSILGTSRDQIFLSGWKEIAAYVNRGVRTVQRWEKDLAFPIRRPRRKSRSPVIALRSDIDSWIRSRPTNGDIPGSPQECDYKNGKLMPCPSGLVQEARLLHQRIARSQQELHEVVTRLIRNVERNKDALCSAALRETGSSRLAYFPGDIERTFWLTGHADLLRLLHNTIGWITRDESIVDVQGDGFIEMFAWETTAGYAIHLLNYTNANAHHGWLNSVHSLGPQKVSMKLPGGVKVKTVELLSAGIAIPFRVESEVLTFSIPHVEDYEVAAVSVG